MPPVPLVVANPVGVLESEELVIDVGDLRGAPLVLSVVPVVDLPVHVSGGSGGPPLCFFFSFRLLPSALAEIEMTLISKTDWDWMRTEVRLRRSDEQKLGDVKYFELYSS